MASKSQQEYYSRYKSSNLWKKNREAKLLRELKRNPNNEKQINEALGNIVYRRKTPNNKAWSHSMRRAAEIIKYFGGKASIELFSTNPAVAKAALLNTGSRSTAKGPEGVVDFSLGARLQGNK